MNGGTDVLTLIFMAAVASASLSGCRSNGRTLYSQGIVPGELERTRKAEICQHTRLYLPSSSVSLDMSFKFPSHAIHLSSRCLDVITSPFRSIVIRCCEKRRQDTVFCGFTVCMAF